MKVQVFLSLCLVAMCLTGAYAQRHAPSNEGTSTRAPSSQGLCPAGKGGVGGLLDSVGNLVGNLLLNVEGVLAITTKLPNGLSILGTLKGLLEVVHQLVDGLLGGLNLTHGVLPGLLHGHLEGIVRNVINLLDGVLGKGTGSSYACSAPAGGLGSLGGLDGVLNSVLGLLNGGLLGGSSGLGGLGSVLTTLPAI